MFLALTMSSLLNYKLHFTLASHLVHSSPPIRRVTPFWLFSSFSALLCRLLLEQILCMLPCCPTLFMSFVVFHSAIHTHMLEAFLFCRFSVGSFCRFYSFLFQPKNEFNSLRKDFITRFHNCCFLSLSLSPIACCLDVCLKTPWKSLKTILSPTIEMVPRFIYLLLYHAFGHIYM